MKSCALKGELVNGFPNTLPIGSHPAGASFCGALDRAGRVLLAELDSLCYSRDCVVTAGMVRSRHNWEPQRPALRFPCVYHGRK